MGQSWKYFPKKVNYLIGIDISLRNHDGPLPIEAMRAGAINDMYYYEMGRTRFVKAKGRLEQEQK
jgi:hypothetical protein